MHLKLEEIAKKLAAEYTDKEIMQDLKLKRRTFYYKAKVCSMYGNIAVENCKLTGNSMLWNIISNYLTYHYIDCI
jgi:hypothetical protein